MDHNLAENSALYDLWIHYWSLVPHKHQTIALKNETYTYIGDVINFSGYGIHSPIYTSSNVADDALPKNYKHVIALDPEDAHKPTAI